MGTAVVRMRLLGPCEETAGNLVDAGWDGWSEEGRDRNALIRRRLRQLTWTIPQALNEILDTVVYTYRPYAAPSDRSDKKSLPLLRTKTYGLARDRLSGIEDWVPKTTKDGEPAPKTPKLPPWTVSWLVYNAVSDIAESAYNRWLKGRSQGNGKEPSFPKFKSPHPIPVRDRGVRLSRETVLIPHEKDGERTLKEEKGAFVIRLHLFEGEPPTSFRVVGTGPSTWASLNRIVDGSYVGANASIIYDDRPRRGGWFVNMTYHSERLEGTIEIDDTGTYLVRPTPPERDGLFRFLAGVGRYFDGMQGLRALLAMIGEAAAYSKKTGGKKSVEDCLRQLATSSPGKTRRPGRASHDPGGPKVRLLGAENVHHGEIRRVTGSWVEDGDGWWVFRVAFTVRQVAELPDGDNAERLDISRSDAGVYVRGSAVGVIVLGLYNWLYLVASNGFSRAWPGSPISSRIYAFNAKAERLRREPRDAPPRCRGRGTKRRKPGMLAHSDAWSRYTTTVAKQYASDVIRQCVRRDIGYLVVADMAGIREAVEIKEADEEQVEAVRVLVHQFPFGKIVQALRSAADKYGIGFAVHQTHGIASVCPMCMSDRLPTGSRKFRCSNPKCGFERDVDAVEAMNMLLDVGSDEALDPVYQEAIDHRKFYGATAALQLVSGGMLESYARRRAELIEARKAAQKEGRRQALKAHRAGKQAMVAKEGAKILSAEIRRTRRRATGT